MKATKPLKAVKSGPQDTGGKKPAGPQKPDHKK